MERLSSKNIFEIVRRPKVRRTTAAFAGGAVVASLSGCIPPDQNVPAPQPTIVQAEAPTCKLKVTHDPTTTKNAGREYTPRVTVTNPDNLPIQTITYIFGDGVTEDHKPNEHVSHIYGDTGHWRIAAVANVEPPEGVEYTIPTKQITCIPTLIDLYVR